MVSVLKQIFTYGLIQSYQPWKSRGFAISYFFVTVVSMVVTGCSIFPKMPIEIYRRNTLSTVKLNHFFYQVSCKKFSSASPNKWTMLINEPKLEGDLVPSRKLCRTKTVTEIGNIYSFNSL